MAIERPALERTLGAARQRLFDARTPAGHWVGELSSSALSTATAVCALRRAPGDHADLVRRGLDWLATHQNDDGGWGDTVLSKTNLSTTLLVWAAFADVVAAEYPGGLTPAARAPNARVPRPDAVSGRVPVTGQGHGMPCSYGTSTAHQPTIARTEAWLRGHIGSLEPRPIARAVDAVYGNDRTFSAPILTTLALAGRLGPPETAWPLVRGLPFELAACPHRWFQWLRLPVVSYALPALIAIGQVRHHFRPTRNPVTRLIRNLLRQKTLRKLLAIQPASGGFLEATPLTSFVVLSLASAGQAGNPVTVRGVEFLKASAREDGSWPIDTNLATWTTTLAVNALAGAGSQPSEPHDARPILDWLLGQQHLSEHPYTHAAPGGWAWTDLSGGVPDADDTAGAVLALWQLAPEDARAREAAAAGIRWLLDLQNRDGGIPTFCRGWGALPFDRSAPDLTAHAVAAWSAWLDRLPPDLRGRTEAAIAAALAYMERVQTADGAWVPLWFGNQAAPRSENPTYGTARAAVGIEPLITKSTQARRMWARGIGWLLTHQNPDGGWGGDRAAPSSIEETALAVTAIAGAAGPQEEDAISTEAVRGALTRGTEWLIRHTEEGTNFDAAPIGFYFAVLWYYERLYPVIFTVGALERVSKALA